MPLSLHFTRIVDSWRGRTTRSHPVVAESRDD